MKGVVTTLAIGLFSLGVLAAEATATTSGQNGPIVFERDGDLWRLTPGEAPKRLTKTKSPTLRNVSSPSVSPNGKWIAFNMDVPDTQLFLLKTNGKKLKAVGDVRPCNADNDPSWSPDGKRLAFRCVLAKGFNQRDIFTVGTNGKGSRRVSTNGDGYYSAWSPDGSRIAVVTIGGAIFNYPASGGGERW